MKTDVIISTRNIIRYEQKCSMFLHHDQFVRFYLFLDFIDFSDSFLPTPPLQGPPAICEGMWNEIDLLTNHLSQHLTMGGLNPSTWSLGTQKQG